MTNQEYQIVVISLRRSLNRRNQVSKELNKTNLNWSFIDAVDGSLFQQYPKEYKSGKVL